MPGSRTPAQPILFPADPGDGTALVLVPDAEGLPRVAWLGQLPAGADTTAWAGETTRCAPPGPPLLDEHARGSFRRPGLRGSRLGDAGGPPAGRDWSTSFGEARIGVDGPRLLIEATDAAAGLTLRTEAEALPGGALRIRHALTNTGAGSYLVEGLDVALPLADAVSELLDFTGRHERERMPQRGTIRDGMWLREARRGRPGLESPSMIVAGAPGFGFGHGEVVGVHVGYSGNCALWVERDPASATTIGGGELLLPGELVLGTGDTYTMPWVYVVTAPAGLDSLAAALHTWQRTLPEHPAQQPVILNVWEAVYFDHGLDRLTELAERAARVGVERFVLDDGWFRGRRDDSVGLGDWWVDQTVWPAGLHPLIERVRGLGMQFGLWFEPEMVNPDSDLYRAHPDWILSAGARRPQLARNQFVLDLTNPDLWQYLLERMDAVLTEYPIDYVKWDHNRDLLEAGSTTSGGRPAVHAQTLAYYALLAELRRRHPRVAWESCASGGGRIDLGVLERVQRVWTSDMTDALSRQLIQRWTVQLVAPEYLGAHVSATTSHQTGRTLSLDFRAATALFGAFGIEWDLTTATEDELDRLAEWTALHKRFRPLIGSGRTMRADTADPAVLLHGVVAADRRSALVAHVQLDESTSNRGVRMRIPGLQPRERYALTWAGPYDTHPMARTPQVDPQGPTGGLPVTGAVLGEVGVWLPRRRPETILLVHAEAQS